jgi:gamma-glutamylcyclotransferase (GGCT)/AIG2-like uncharacterized protein YtfP
MTDLVFFYGTLMSGFARPGRIRLNSQLKPISRGSIEAALFDLGPYPAAVPAPHSRVWGEVHQMLDVPAVLTALDGIEGFTPEEPENGLYTRAEIPVRLEDGRVEFAWAYFYNAPLGNATRIDSGDYREHLKVKF